MKTWRVFALFAPPGPLPTSGRSALLSDPLLVCVSSHDKSLLSQPVSKGDSHISIGFLQLESLLKNLNLKTHSDEKDDFGVFNMILLKT